MSSTPTPGSSSRLSPTLKNGSESTKALVPTNNVTTMEGTIVRARIDPALTVEDVVKQLCVNLKIKDSSSGYALRDEADELVTSENLRKKIKGKVNLRLVRSPLYEAQNVIAKLQSHEEKSTRMTLFSLQKLVKEPEFAQHFLNYDGLAMLVDSIHSCHGNTLAYGLTAMQHLMDLEYGWSSLNDAFILRIVRVLTSQQSLVNVTRPATVILKKFVEAEPTNHPSQGASSSQDPPRIPADSVYRYGFKAVYVQMQKEPNFMQTVIQRLGSAETATVQYSMMLINSLLTHASEEYWEDFIAELERLDVRKAVMNLMSSHTSEDLTSCILDFQANMVRVTYQKKRSFVDYHFNLSHKADLDYIWLKSSLMEQPDIDDTTWKWRLIGFNTEDLEQEFDAVGVLGLDCLREFVRRVPDFSKIVSEQLARPLERRCPIAKASNEVVELLSEHWSIFAPGYSTSTTFQPFFLDFYKAHTLATQFFLRMWTESGAATGDFIRVTALVRSQVKVALRSENVRLWYEVEKDFVESEYRAVRERQMKELELEDDLLNKAPVRNLRAKIYKESYEFVRQQRIQCLLHGAWFVNAVPLGSNTRPSRPWRFMRLDIGLKFLHYVDSAMKFPVREGMEDLPERIELAAISEIATGTCSAPPGVLRDYSEHVPAASSSSTSSPSPLSFSLLSALEGSLADQIAPDHSRWADWTDGLNMLRRDGGHVASKETAGFVQALTEIGLKIKLLDLSGEMVEIPSGLAAGPPPSNTDFFFSDL